MSAKSLFGRIRDGTLARGRSQRTVTRKTRLLETVSFADS
jgi:hypothetical protein